MSTTIERCRFSLITRLVFTHTWWVNSLSLYENGSEDNKDKFGL